MDTRKLLDIRQAAEILRVHPGTVYRWARAHRVPSVRISARVLRFDPRALDKFIAANTNDVRPTR